MTMRIGIDLGSVNIKVVVTTPDGNPVQVRTCPGRGRSLEVLLAVLEDLAHDIGGRSPVHVACTGIGKTLLDPLASVHKVNEVVATALAVCRRHPHIRTIVDLGGQFTKWILVDRGLGRDGSVADFATNGLCAAGSGAFLEQQAGRLHLTLEQLSSLAAEARGAATIAGRCAVFAKSDMIHLQQKGTPLEEIALGLCRALVRTFLATVLQGRKLESPVALVGGGAVNPGLVRSFHEELGFDENQLMALDEPFLLGALGAAMLASGATTTTLAEISGKLRELRGSGKTSEGTGGSLPPLDLFEPGRAEQLPEDPETVEGPVEAYLGVDLGSVSTNLVLVDTQARMLQGIYLPTRGQPLAALEEGLERIRAKLGDRLTVLGVGTTGSGRHLAARILGADVIHNEITAQMISTTHYIREVDTIFEIGGQDSKFISVHDGQLADFEMNKICAAGTGSFLEEQADRFGVAIVDEFARLALQSRSPVDLGTRCTVFMDTEVVRAFQHGAAIEDICAGLAYSVARNYLEKVAAGHPIGKCVVFQGGTASNRAVVQAFQHLLDRPVQVHPYNRLSGAIGAALLAMSAQQGQGYRTRFLGLDACANPEPTSFECHRCENRCRVNRIRMGPRVVHFGDVCERYSQRDRETKKADRPFPELFEARARLLEEHLETDIERAPGEPIGLLRASINLELLPFWTTFLRQLGFEPRAADPVGPARTSLAREKSLGVPPEVCLPIKVAAAQARALLDQVERVFIPELIEVRHHPEDRRAATCLYNQQLGHMLRAELGDRVACPQFVLSQGLSEAMESVRALSETLNRSIPSILSALTTARLAHGAFVRARSALGRAALEARFDRAVVVLGKPYNTHDPSLNLHLAQHLDEVGLWAIPWDLIPTHWVRLDPRWDSLPWHFNREQLRVLERIRQDDRLFPLWVSSFGCGPDAFSVKHLEQLLKDRPRLLLEFDAHQGEAGLVTRLEAFADEIEAFQHSSRLTSRSPRRTRPSVGGVGAGRVLLPHLGHPALIYAAALQSEGVSTEVLPPPDNQTVRLGEQHASGRECHPWVILLGEMVRALGNGELRHGDVFLMPVTVAPCLIAQYGDAHRIVLDRLDAAGVEVWDVATAQLGSVLGRAGLLRLYEALLIGDILFALAGRLRPYERQPGTLDTLFTHALDQVMQALKSRAPLGDVLGTMARAMWDAPHHGRPGDRPVIGVTGDLYTRMHPLGNAGLFQKLEELGCEVWPSPYFADLAELKARVDAPHLLETGRLREAVDRGLTLAATAGVRARLYRRLSDPVCSLVREPEPGDMVRMASGYVGDRASYLVVQAVGKLVDFLERGATGAINAAGLNCMVGVATAAAVPAIQARFGQAPLVNLYYGGQEGPAQQLRLETFVHQVKKRWPGQDQADKKRISA